MFTRKVLCNVRNISGNIFTKFCGGINSKFINNRRYSKQAMDGSDSSQMPKLLNILIYSENSKASNNLKTLISKVLDCERYTIYTVSRDVLEKGGWKGKCALLTVIGDTNLGPLLLEYFLNGGKMFSLHSNFLSTLLPSFKFKSKEDISTFSYENFKSVQMKQSIFIDANGTSIKDNNINLTIERKDLKIRILARNDSNSPALILIKDLKNNGTALFSQIHFEDTTENEDTKIEIVKKIFQENLNLHVVSQKGEEIKYTVGYFLGNTENIMKVISENGFKNNNQDLTLNWCPNNDSIEQASKNFLPIYFNEHPNNFSADEYFSNLTSEHIGRSIIYTDVISSTMRVVENPLIHGLAVTAQRQMSGQGRGGNTWITPLGQAAISLQIWQKVSPVLTLFQHASALAIILAIRKEPYEDLNVRIKWPNDIYYGREIKIGGVITTANVFGEDVIINIGTGVNISNKNPTTCVNDIILEYNANNRTKLPHISVEYFLARYCSELENVLKLLNKEGVETFLDLYYKYWLHDDEEIRVKSENGTMKGKILGIDEGGWLSVRTPEGEMITVSPDGNTFDMMSGLIAPKV